MPDNLPILVAEDDDDDFFNFSRAARTAGISNPLLRFRDGSELITFIEQELATLPADFAPLLLFVDLTMPLMNGFEVLQRIQGMGPNRFMSVVLSGSRREEDVKRAFALGAEEYLTKPISPLILAAIAARQHHVA